MAGSSQGRCSALGPRLRHVLLEEQVPLETARSCSFQERALPIGDLVVPAISDRCSFWVSSLHEEVREREHALADERNHVCNASQLDEDVLCRRCGALCDEHAQPSAYLASFSRRNESKPKRRSEPKCSCWCPWMYSSQSEEAAAAAHEELDEDRHGSPG